MDSTPPLNTGILTKGAYTAHNYMFPMLNTKPNTKAIALHVLSQCGTAWYIGTNDIVHECPVCTCTCKAYEAWYWSKRVLHIE